MNSSYKDMLKAHIMFSITTTNQLPLQAYVQQLMQEHAEARQAILTAYEDVKRELVTVQVAD
ncbi:hypothetical protein [Kurthia massiliensis]|uniref:hypothetical protein n=1 Tax=Kurthia massiliensis TaxID=1033739 RepID=UPI000287E313|nr:hypothetical protein [Kurthia massiliensis]